MHGIRIALLSHTLRTSGKRINIKQLLIAVGEAELLQTSWAEREETAVPDDYSLLDSQVHSSFIFPLSQ